ncbi:unnamed protein product [Didymodactylos carnosus]|uniref:Amidase domain-containing protein n=1 Tax=Didymodactylos carnosus TaxID=1234261 RepID=A0A8S2Q076_9BILA|nr:unnamed protein product [Didymodactylos carnosus]CAF4075770.1 unnamed protein product [Didymodactylos carnosus]
MECIKEVNHELRAVIEINPDALKIARKLHDQRKQQGSPSPLDGIPILVKDNILVSDSAIATSTGLCAGTLGTETDGSIISPSNLAATVEIKPTVG